MGRLTVKEGEMITMRDLYMAGIATGIDDGIKLLAGVSANVFCALIISKLLSPASFFRTSTKTP